MIQVLGRQIMKLWNDASRYAPNLHHQPIQLRLWYVVCTNMMKSDNEEARGRARHRTSPTYYCSTASATPFSNCQTAPIRLCKWLVLPQLWPGTAPLPTKSSRNLPFFPLLPYKIIRYILWRKRTSTDAGLRNRSLKTILYVKSVRVGQR